MSKNKLIYLFSEGNKSMKTLLGGKGANLAEMMSIGLPVPPGFTVTTEACNEYYSKGGTITQDLKSEIFKALSKIEEDTDKKFGDKLNPLLVSVRSGAVISMPGMMDTVLNLGLNDETVKGLSKKTDNERFALDSYRRFIQMFGDVVLKIEHHLFEKQLDQIKKRYNVTEDTELTIEALKELIDSYKQITKAETGREFPQEPKEQLLLAIQSVFDSWNNQRAKVYRDIHDIAHDLGTAVNIQAMVFGNMGEDSGTGVAFTRNPSNGEKEVYGEFLLNAQGEDVVAGIRTPKSIDQLEKDFPKAYKQFMEVSALLEKHYQDMQDIEFTVENKKLYLLQTRNGKRTAEAAVKIAVDMYNEKLITKKSALTRVEPNQIAHLLHPQIDLEQELKVLTKGLPASPGAATGELVFDSNEAEELSSQGKKVILVRPETTPDDIHGIVAAEGILTTRGGMTSHAAVVARGMGKPCVTGCDEARVDLDNQELKVNDKIIQKGEIVSIDGSTGNLIMGSVKLTDPGLNEECQKLLKWADEIESVGVRANADTPEDAKKAREFGATGIGLCRTEHMFMGTERLPKIQEMIISDSEIEREEALEKLLPYQEQDFYEILKAMDGYPTTIRLLDPPLHEFLPNVHSVKKDLDKLINQYGENSHQVEQQRQLLNKVRSLEESNPMLGFRGCRLGILYPEIYIMQAKAIARAAKTLVDEGYTPKPEIMIPLVGHDKELVILKEMIEDVIEKHTRSEHEQKLYHIGTMLELPRACVTADEIAEHAEFFSFGTNDLTQTALGYSRDDAEGKFLAHYMQNEIIPENPFMTIDQKGVGELITTAVDKASRTKPGIKLGVCGEHGGDSQSIEFFYKVGLNYVSCSPFRVPVARLSAAQAALKLQEE
ncbi:pyruvate, phosphate dikinase [Natranaerobius trueperi]|uniref:Pyruvate, phosphate dikinase n=1 Tax=Natranaerobius trueperi TaxID=759412 RepID=A0A226BVQ8_9FIRM|nr:pyruvate, phosphate dikinase [Natranaerobius trueperi]OWZ83073.1 pyruvate, phosphate dikinase [Natranaerobius trueperi]